MPTRQPASAPSGAPQPQPIMPPTPATPAVPPPAPPAIFPPPGYIDPQAHAEALSRARQEEKDKLYKEREQLKAQLGELKSQLKNKSTPDEQLTSQLAELKEQLTDTTARLEASTKDAQEAQANWEKETLRLRLEAYMHRRLVEEKDKGTKMLTEYVGGASEADIDASIEYAKQEYGRLQRFFAEQQQLTPSAPPQQSSAPVVVQAVPLPGPGSFPVAPNASTPPTNGPGGVAFREHVQNVTSPEAVRNGTWAQNRAQVLQHLRQNGGPPPAGVFANSPRFMPDPHASTTFGDVTVPTGHPSGPVANPNYQTPPSPQGPPNPAQVPVNGGQAPAQNPSAEWAAQARSNAVAAAGRALSSPSQAISGAATTRPIGQPPPGYGNVPVQNADFNSGHPMIRSS